MASSTTPTATATGSDFCNNNNNSPMSMHSHQPPPMDQQQPPTIPMLPCQSVEENGFHSPAVLLNYAAPPPSSAHQQQLVPLLLDFPAPTSFYQMPSHFPLQTMAGHQQFAAAFGPSFSPMPFSAFPPTSAFVDPLFLPAQHKVVAPFPMPFSTPPVSGSSSSGSANSPPKERQRQQSEDVEQHREAAFAFHSPAAEQYEPKKTQVRWQQDLDRQMSERRLAEQLEAEQQAQAQRTLEREEAEMARRAEEQRAAEERRRTHKIEIRDQCEQSCLDGLQRAQREAELLRRAKLFRHILLDGQADLETARKVLKAEGEDRQLVGQVLKQLRDLELQRRLSTDSKGSSSPHPSKSPKTATPPRAKEAGTSPSAGGNFCRANSWSVKQPRTLPSHSLLPVPVRQKLHQRTRAENGCPDPANHQQMSTHTQSATGQGLAARRTGAPAPVPLPIKSTVDNNNKSVADERKNNTANSRQMMNRPTPPPGLFGQLTLRRPRRSSLGATDMTALLDEQQDNGDHHSPAHGNLNGQSPADKSKAISSSNGSANCHRDQRQANGGDGSRNPSSSVASSTQPNSPGSSSLESSSVVKFRALLLSPAGSQEDLAADLPPPTPISIFRKPNLPAARNGGPLLMPPSPFSRKNSTNTKDGNNGQQQQDCFGDGELRRSLRSPTMRRLQDSLQSLATVDGHGGGEGTSGGESRGGTPKPFNCRSSQYRSFNLRRETARQKQILEHLATVRAQLKNSQAQLECTISKQNLAATEADGDVHL